MRNTSDLLITMAALFGRIVGAVRAADRKWFSGLENRIKFSCRSLARLRRPRKRSLVFRRSHRVTKRRAKLFSLLSHPFASGSGDVTESSAQFLCQFLCSVCESSLARTGTGKSALFSGASFHYRRRIRLRGEGIETLDFFRRLPLRRRPQKSCVRAL